LTAKKKEVEQGRQQPTVALGKKNLKRRISDLSARQDEIHDRMAIERVINE